MTIKHIVVSGGGPVGLVTYGALKELSLKNIVKLENIESIYATSIGCYIALIYMLNFDWEWMDNYLIKRPWENTINIGSSDYLNFIYTKGLLNETFIINTIKPLFLAKDIDINITLKEFYELTKIDFHILTCNFNKFCKKDINYISDPNLELYKAIMMSSAIPLLIQPPYYKNEYYLDGGIFCNCPLNECYLNNKCEKSEILAFINDKRFPIELNNESDSESTNKSNIDNKINVFNFVMILLKNIFKKINEDENVNLMTIKNIINVGLSKNSIDLNYWLYVFKNMDERARIIKLGTNQANNYIINNIIDSSNNVIESSNIILDSSNNI